MQIHELNSFVGTPSATDYLAIDDGTETNKVPATALGVSTQMTQAEAEAGTITAPRVVSPSVFKASVESLAETREVLAVNVASFSSLPQTITNANITEDMVVVNSVLGTPSARTSDWAVTPANGSVTITGSISGSTTLTLYLVKSRAQNATSIIKYDGDSAWKTGDTTTTRPIKYRLRNGICFINAFYSGEVTVDDTLQLITTLPSEYRPTTTVYFPATNRGSSAHGFGYIDTDGKLYLRNTLGGMGYFCFDVSYPVK